MALEAIYGDRRRESGSALFVAVMMLTLMGFLGLAALDRVTRDEQVAGYQNRARTAFYAAEAGIADARRRVRNDPVPTLPDDTAKIDLADAALFDREAGLPRYYGDYSVPDGPIYVKREKPHQAGGNLQTKGTKLMEKLWEVNALGESPDGSLARLQSIEVTLGSGGGLTGSY
jgi:PilX N-terminal